MLLPFKQFKVKEYSHNPDFRFSIIFVWETNFVTILIYVILGHPLIVWDCEALKLIPRLWGKTVSQMC
jgi:hypothetical protein